MDEDFPDKCPVCKKITNNILLHINKKESCKEKVSPELYSKWKNEGNKRKKRRYQAKYVESGKHNIAQANYIQKCKEVDKDSFLQQQRHTHAKFRNKERIISEKHGEEERQNAFKTLCITCLWFLKQGRTPSTQNMNKFHLVEGETGLENDEVHDWLKNIDSGLLDSVITFQKIVLVPKSRWLSALEVVKDNPDKEELKEKLFKIISNLQAYKNENTTDILIPDEYKSNFKPPANEWSPLPEDFSKEDEVMLDRLVATIIGEEEEILDGSLQSLLKISKDMKILNLALAYTNWNFQSGDENKRGEN